MAQLKKVAIRGQTWRRLYDPWDGSVLEMDENKARLSLQNMSRVDLKMEMGITRAMVTEEIWEQLALGTVFTCEFKVDGDEPYISLSFGW